MTQTPRTGALAVIRDRAAQRTEYLPHLIDALILTGHPDKAWHTGQARANELLPSRRVELVELRRSTHLSDHRPTFLAKLEVAYPDS